MEREPGPSRRQPAEAPCGRPSDGYRFLELFESSFQFDTGPMLERAGDELDAAIHDVADDTRGLCGHVLEDSPPNALIDIAHRYGLEAIVVGSNGHERFGHLVGANIGRLLHLSDVPVIVVPEDALDDDELLDESAKPSEVVVGVTGDRADDEQLVAWASRTSHGGVPVHLVHAISPTLLVALPSLGAAEAFAQRADEHLSYLTADHPEWATSVVFERPVHALAEASADATMIVVGSHRSSRMTGFLTGAIVQHLPTLASCPVAVVPVTDSAIGEGGREST